METVRNYSILKKSLKYLILILFLFSTYSLSFADNLTITTSQKGDSLIFTYFYEFSNGAKESILAVEKPKDAKIIKALDSFNNPIKVSEIGDFLRVELFKRDIDNFTLEFSTQELYYDIFDENELKFYVNSNIEFEYIKVNLALIREFNEVIELFPREYKHNEEENTILIIQKGSLKDNLFEVKYEEDNQGISSWLIVLFSAPILFFIMLFLFLKVSTKPVQKDKEITDYIKDNEDENTHKFDIKEEKSKEYLQPKTKKHKKINDDESNNNLKTNHTDDELLIESLEENELIENTPIKKELDNTSIKYKNEEISQMSNEIEEYIQKYLTENEQDVIRIIKKHEGIIQQEILDILPIITKSTLSKIITKLEGRRILERVRVGKINKLYLGEKLLDLNKTEDTSNENKENDSSKSSEN